MSGLSDFVSIYGVSIKATEPRPQTAVHRAEYLIETIQ